MPLSDFQTVFSGNPLDRSDPLRFEAEILGSMSTADNARYALFAQDRVLGDESGDILWVKASQCRFLPIATKILLGQDAGGLCYAADLAGEPEEFEGMFGPGKFRDARAVAMKLGHPHPNLGIIAQAKSMLAWHKSHRFCAKCGAESTLVKAGYERKCMGCGASHFPRTDPVVIMLARFGHKALVGRGPQLPPNIYSALAGFMEPGETIEEAVARELWEEAGVKVSRVRYVTSQPWPWPSSLMIACMAWVEDDALTLDEKEIEDARWITREDAREAFAGERPDLILPSAVAIAHNLIQAWLDE